MRIWTCLCNCNDLAIGTPSCLFEVLRDLCCFPRPSLTNDYGDWVGLDEVEEALPVPRNREKRRWFVQGGDEGGSDVEFCHGG